MDSTAYFLETARTPAQEVAMSDDAVPALVDALPDLPPAARLEVPTSVCAQGAEGGRYRGWAADNPSVDAAAEAPARVCP